MTLSSNALRKLNIVKIYYTDSQGAQQPVFDDSSAPLYYIGDTLPNISFGVESDDAWGTSANLLNNPMARAVIQGITSKIDGLQGFSGTIDLRSKFSFKGSQPLDFNVKCMLVNYEGWNTSIAPTLNKIADWILPTNWKGADGKDYVIGEAFVNKLKEQQDEQDERGAFIGSLYSLLVDGLDAIRGWIGDAKLLNVPQEYKILETSNNKAYLYIGPAKKDSKTRFLFSDVYIDRVDITIPRFFMLNADQEPEPDRVEISFHFKSLRQVTRSMVSF